MTRGSVNSAPVFFSPVGGRRWQGGRAVRLQGGRVVTLLVLQGGRAVGVAGRTVKELLLCCRPFCTLHCALFVARPASTLFVHRRGRGIDRFLAASVRLCILPRVLVATSEQKRPAWEQRRKESVMSTWPSSRSKPSAMMVRFLGLVCACVIIVAFVCSFASFFFPHDCLYYGLLVDALGCRSVSGVMAEKCPTFFRPLVSCKRQRLIL